MAKKSKDEVPNPNSVANRDILQRLNFLYQASQLLGSMAKETPSVPPRNGLTGTERRKERKLQNKKRHPTNMADLSRSYVRSMKVIGQKTNVRMDPCVKRTMCKGCSVILIPGATATVRVNPSKARRKFVVYTCMSCNTSRRIPAPPVQDTSVSAEASQSAAPTDTAAADEMDTRDEDPTVADERQRDPVDGKQPVLRRSRRIKANASHPPPFFEQDVGHVVFRGNDRLE